MLMKLDPLLPSCLWAVVTAEEHEGVVLKFKLLKRLQEANQGLLCASLARRSCPLALNQS